MAQASFYYRMACREMWRESAFRVRLAGGDPGHEPDFGLGAQRTAAEEDALFAGTKATYEAKHTMPNGRKVPGKL